MADDELFIGRQPQGRLSRLQAQGIDLPDDRILARILRLQGMEPGVNKEGDVDSYNRYIYIHGTDDEAQISKPVSHGCIRMRKRDVIDLFDRVTLNTDVYIEA